MSAADDYSEFLERLADSHQQRITGFLQVTENDLANYLQTAPSTDGAMFDVEWAVNARTEMKRILEEDYLAEVQDMLGDYNAVARRQLKMLNNFGKFTRVAPEAIAGLQQLSFQGFEALANQQLETLANGVYQSALTGKNKDEFIQEVRGQINGIYQASDQEEIRQLVEVAQNSTGAAQQAAVDRLHRVYASDRLGNNLRRYATSYATDSLNQYSATLTLTTANEQGIDTFEYYGDVIRDSREFCKKHVGKEYTADEIRKIWEGSWAGKAAGDPFIVRGGYNCRHQWLPVVEPKDKTEEPEQPPTQRALPVRTKSSVQTAIQDQAAKAATDAKYPTMTSGKPALRYGASGTGGFDALDKARDGLGKVELPKTLSDDAASLAQEVFDTGTNIAKKYNLPMLRGMRTTGGRRAVMAMGDGVLEVNVSFLDAKSAQITGAGKEAAEKLAKDKARLESMRSDLAIERDALPDLQKSVDATTYKEAVLDFNKKVDAINRLNKKIAKSDAFSLRAASNWKVGDDLKDRPFAASDYFEDPLDQAKNTVIHEIGHHMHQLYGVTSEKDYFDPPMEDVVKKLFRKRKGRVSPSKYADTDSMEWFAESFSLYEAGKDELIDPRLTKLFGLVKDNASIDKIQRIMGET